MVRLQFKLVIDMKKDKQSWTGISWSSKLCEVSDKIDATMMSKKRERGKIQPERDTEVCPTTQKGSSGCSSTIPTSSWISLQIPWRSFWQISPKKRREESLNENLRLSEQSVLLTFFLFRQTSKDRYRPFKRTAYTSYVHHPLTRRLIYIETENVSQQSCNGWQELR